ncbi:MAG: hypothetical protein HF973_10260 [Chloroflexi bacterium]|nr:hypothetical protein [Chloroflexota bacterium]
MFRRVIGVIMLIIGVVGLLIGIGGVYASSQFIDTMGERLDKALVLTSDSLNNLVSTLDVARSTLVETNKTMETVQQSLTGVGKTLSDTKPMIEQSSTIVTQEIPDSIEAMQETLPAIEQAAGTIDKTLSTLSSFKIEQEILGIPIGFDLGIEYDPSTPFDQAIADVGDSLEGMPETLRGLETHLDTTAENLDLMSQDMDQLSANLGGINEELAKLDPIMVEYIRIVNEANSDLQDIQAELASLFQTLKTVALVLFSWFALMQIVPLYLGYELVTGQRDPDQYVTEDELDEELAKTNQKQADTAVTGNDDAGEGEAAS